ncbi:unnamed protein product [Boreogadus saida]
MFRPCCEFESEAIPRCWLPSSLPGLAAPRCWPFPSPTSALPHDSMRPSSPAVYFGIHGGYFYLAEAKKRGPSFSLEDTQDKRHNNNLLRRRGDELLGPGGRGFEPAGGPTPGCGLQEAPRGPLGGEEQRYVLCKCQAGAAVKIQPGHGPRLGPEESSDRADHTLPRPIGPGFLY